MPVSYNKLFDLMQERGVKKIDLRTKYKINPKTVDSLHRPPLSSGGRSRQAR